MRLFTGIGLPPNILSSLEHALDNLRPAADINWSPLENLHITTKFIGEWPEGRLDEMYATLSGLSGRPSFEIEVRGIGWFPNPHSPRVLWTAVHADNSLKDLARDTEQALAELGVAVEQRAYSPHLTLARIKAPAQLARLRQKIAALPSQHFGKFRVNCFNLYRSVLSPKGSKYSILREFPL
jgi:2'-5' RNA ligase